MPYKNIVFLTLTNTNFSVDTITIWSNKERSEQGTSLIDKQLVRTTHTNAHMYKKQGDNLRITIR